jgi:hypothetical protein
MTAAVAKPALKRNWVADEAIQIANEFLGG